MLKYSYLFINILSVLGPIILSFDKKVHFYKKWKFIFPGLLITSVIFLIWDIIFTQKGVWSFNDDYILGIKFWNLPLEEILFFITIPFACLFIYECLDCYFPEKFLPKHTKYISYTILAISLFISILNTRKYYTFINFSFLAMVLLYAIFQKFEKMSAYYRAYLICLLPFYIVNGILTAIPIVRYHNHQNLGIRIGTIPLEDHFYLMSLLLINVYFYEKFKKQKHASI